MIGRWQFRVAAAVWLLLSWMICVAVTHAGSSISKRQIPYSEFIYWYLQHLPHPMSSPLSGDAATGDRFGHAIDVKYTPNSLPFGSDIYDVAVGAPADDTPSGIDSGSVYLYRFEAGAWRSVARHLPERRMVVGRFGSAVAFVGSTLLVGAPGTPLETGGTGVVWVYSFSPPKSIEPPAGYGLVLDFGRRIVAQENRMLIAAQDHVFVYALHQGNWILDAVIKNADMDLARIDFAADIALQGDYLIIGSPARSGVAGSSQALVYQKLGTQWQLQATLKPPAGSDFSSFGSKVAMSNGLVVIADPASSVEGRAGAGRVYVYADVGAQWHIIAQLTSERVVDGNGFGAAIALSRNLGHELRLLVVDATGRMELYGVAQFSWRRLVSADALRPMAGFSGGLAMIRDRAFMWKMPATTDTGQLSDIDEVSEFRLEDVRIQPQGSLPRRRAVGDSGLGSQVVAYRNLVIASMPGEVDAVGVSKGAVYVHRTENGAWTYIQRLQHPENRAGRFGSALLLVGDELLVGSPAAQGQQSEGVVLHYRFEFGRWVHRGSILPQRAGEPGFGAGLAYHGNRLAVVSTAVQSPHPTHHVHLFERQGSEWIPHSTALVPVDDEHAHRAIIALGPNVLFWGRPGYPAAGRSIPGSVLPLVFAEGQWIEAAPVLTPPGSTDEAFGIALDFADGWLAVGAPRNQPDRDRGERLRGAVHLYEWTGRSAIHRQQLTMNGLSAHEDNWFGSALKFHQGSLFAATLPHQLDAPTTFRHEVIAVYRYGGERWEPQLPITGALARADRAEPPMLAIGEGHLVLGMPGARGPESGNLNEGALAVFLDSVLVESSTVGQGNVEPWRQHVPRGGIAALRAIPRAGHQLSSASSPNCPVQRVGKDTILVGPAHLYCGVLLRFTPVMPQP